MNKMVSSIDKGNLSPSLQAIIALSPVQSSAQTQGQGNIFPSMCHSSCKQGGLPRVGCGGVSLQWRVCLLGVCIQEGLHPVGSAPSEGRHPEGRRPEIHWILWNMVSKQVICMLLECILVQDAILFIDTSDNA